MSRVLCSHAQEEPMQQAGCLPYLANDGWQNFQTHQPLFRPADRMSINDVNADAHSEVVEDLPATAMNFLDGAGKLSDFRFCMSQQPKPS